MNKTEQYYYKYLHVYYLHSNVFGEYGPTCSIIGGMIAQEIIKSLSKDSTSSYKLYLFNHLLCQMAGIYLHKDVSKFVEKQIASKGQEEDVIEL